MCVSIGGDGGQRLGLLTVKELPVLCEIRTR